AYVTTDAAVAPTALRKALQTAVGGSFNAITVDSDMSTSDTVVLMASGRAGNQPVSSNSREYAKLLAMVREVCESLAYQIVADGEGMTKVVEVRVEHARNDRDAELAAKSVANSPLFKCAMHGGDPNWGRIAAAAGKSSARVDQDELQIRIGGVLLFSKGAPRRFDEAKVVEHLKGRNVLVEVDLHLGEGSFTAWTCDLSHEYVTINAEYHT
ncbi:MAG: bifunctional ornithine acetyltransferase/N-acetylglutamate synthase, partial [Planctomycetota bacterium]